MVDLKILETTERIFGKQASTSVPHDWNKLRRDKKN